MDKLIDCNNIVGLAKYASRVPDDRGNFRAMIVPCAIDGKRFVVKIIEYYAKTPTGEARPTDSGMKYLTAADTEIATLRLLRERLIRPGVTPCIAEMLSVKVCENCLEQGAVYSGHSAIKYTARSAENSIIRKLSQSYEMYKRGVIVDKLAFIAIESIETTLLAFLYYVRNDSIGRMMITGVLWMTLYTIGAIDRVLPGFRHNDLHISNVMIYTDPNYSLDEGIKYIEYTIEDPDKPPRTYWVPFLGVLPKIIDFGHASVPSEGFASEELLHPLFANKINGDIGYLFTSIHGGILEQASAYAADMAIVQLIDILSPRRYHSKMFPLEESKIPTAFEMLDNEVFSEYRSPKSESQIYSRYRVPLPTPK